VQTTTVAADQPVQQAHTLVTGDGLRSGRRFQRRLLPLRLGQFRLGLGALFGGGGGGFRLACRALSRQRELRTRRRRQEQQAGGEREEAAQAASGPAGYPASQISSSRHPD